MKYIKKSKFFSEKKSKHCYKLFFICSNPYIDTTFVHEMYDRSPEVDGDEGLAEAATKQSECTAKEL